MTKKEDRTVCKNAIAYVRTSTEDQTLGISAQIDCIKTWCKKNKVTLTKVYVEKGVSGATKIEDRPKLFEALHSINGKTLPLFLISKRDRLARDVIIAAIADRLVKKAGGKIISCDGAGFSEKETPESNLMRTIVDAFSQYERALISSRTKAALKQKKTEGFILGHGAPYGFKRSNDNRSYVKNPEEYCIVEKIKELKKNGMTYRKIVDHLNSEYLDKATGKKWYIKSIVSILNRNEKGVILKK